jgi:hypothetical protein
VGKGAPSRRAHHIACHVLQQWWAPFAFAHPTVLEARGYRVCVFNAADVERDVAGQLKRIAGA